jgi:hypothetical protein
MAELTPESDSTDGESKQKKSMKIDTSRRHSLRHGSKSWGGQRAKLDKFGTKSST